MVVYKKNPYHYLKDILCWFIFWVQKDYIANMLNAKYITILYS